MLNEHSAEGEFEDNGKIQHESGALEGGVLDD
jgi:hypothetical protein